MTYVYDLILNFNDELYDFYEWNTDDNLYHIKRINLIKINSKAYNDIIDNKVKLNDELLLSIFNKCEYIDNRKILTIPYAILLSDSYRVMAIILDMNGNIIKYSSLLLDEEEEVLDVTERLGVLKLDYKIKEKKIKNNLTRYENNILKYIRKDLIKSYKEKNINKLKYLYYEYFNRHCDDIDNIYNSLMNELNEYNVKHSNLYNLIKLSLKGKKV